jgi:acyl-CoA reductase-like NAD-dependent aldehyde dehydrogenase
MAVATVSPIDGSILVERPTPTAEQVEATLVCAHAAQKAWAATPLPDRIALLTAFVDAFVANKEAIAEEITRQMGRPIRYTQGEVGGFEDRARTMLALAPQALADVVPAAKAGFKRFVRREPLGVVLVLAPWNYPYLTAVNAIVPALAAGNTVVLKHSGQTPLCSERLMQAAQAAGLPDGVFSYLHADHDQVAALVADERVGFVAFTGSVDGGHAVVQAGADRFVGMGLELGGKDPAYVRADADLAFAIENIVDGAMFNSGQSCCGIERVYVHRSVFDAFVAGAVDLAHSYVLGDPMQPATTLGPMVKVRAADFARSQVADAIAAGARQLVDLDRFPAEGGAYMAPRILVDSDEEAIALMNDSRYGLTASVWSADAAAGEAIGEQLQTGTVFLNRADYLDPELAWTGVKDSGRGCTLSVVGYEHVTRPKSFHLRLRD